MSTSYNADIIEAIDRVGTFVAELCSPSLTAAGPDPEHALCFAMAEAGLPDGPIQFWRGTTPSLFYRSVHRAAGYRIGLGADFPYRCARRRERVGEIIKDRVSVRTETAKPPLAGTLGHPAPTGFLQAEAR